MLFLLLATRSGESCIIETWLLEIHLFICFYSDGDNLYFLGLTTNRFTRSHLLKFYMSLANEICREWNSNNNSIIMSSHFLSLSIKFMYSRAKSHQQINSTENCEYKYKYYYHWYLWQNEILCHRKHSWMKLMKI